MDLESDPEYVPSDSNSNAGPPSPEEAVRKRRHRTPEPPSAPRLKRQKGVFNPRYLTLLNEDITDATLGHIKENPHASRSNSLLDLSHTQLGAVTWTAAEKQAFFSALPRLGRDDLPGIASRIGSKSALEVHQYITLLDAAARARRSDESKRQRAPRPADIPAAAELSTELCAALEEAADGLALRQEAYEASLEQKRWAGRWLITAELAQVLEHQLQQKQRPAQADELPPFVELFPLRNWLRLPERVFMNASVARFADGNWRSVSEERPAIRATALADFYSLVVSVTRRLVSATLFVAGSRIRAKQAGDRRGRISAVVKAKDVQAAVASVGMKENSREFWARAARRLRLDVYNDENEDEAEEEAEEELMEADNEDLSDENEYEQSDVETTPEDDRSEEEEEGQALSNPDDDQEDYESEPDIMPYEAIEAALGFPSTNTTLSTTEPHNEQRGVSGFNSSLYPSSDSDFISDEEDSEISDHNPGEDDEDIPMKSSPSSPTEAPIDAVALEQDLIEALTYSALDYGDTTRSKQALRNRLKNEQRLWVEAERLDARASAAEEARLWSLLRGDEAVRVKTEEMKLELEPELGLPGRRTSLVDLGGNWRDHTEYYSEWEFVEGNRLDDPDG